MKQFFILIAPLLLLIMTNPANAQPPNVLLIMVDDMGYSDLSSYGSEIQTPHLDRLADDGLKFRQLRNYARCCPSRASLLTGRYAHEAQLGWMTAADERRPGYRGGLTRDLPTLAEILKPAGYATHMIGKWHLSPDSAVDAFFKNGQTQGTFPTDRGFESYYGILSGGGNSVSYNDDGTRRGGGYFTPWMLLRDTTHITIPELPEDFFLTQALGDELEQTIQRAPEDEPFFVYYAPYAPHNPVEAPEARVAPLRERYKVGYEQLWRQRIDRMETLGLFPEGIDATQTQPFFERPWTELSADDQAAWIEFAANFAALVECVDDQVGRAVAALEARGELENTLILFLSDNGATKQGGLISRLRANLGNAPFREFKSSSYEGGIASPLIAHWPAGVTARPGFIDARAHISDLVPTILAAAAVDYPERWGLEALAALESQNLLTEDFRARPLFFEHETTRAVVHEEWKLVSGGHDRPWELYDLSVDPFELNNLSRERPELVDKLSRLWAEWAKSHDVLPFETAGWQDRIDKFK